MPASVFKYRRSAVFLVWYAATMALFWGTIEDAVRHSLDIGYGSYILLMPLIAAFLIWNARTAIFERTSTAWVPALYFFASGISLVLLASFLRVQVTHGVISFLGVGAALIFVVAGFVLCYGRDALMRARFPLFILFLGLPLPSALMDQVISVLQSGSTGLTHWMFLALGIPVIREGFALSVPGVTIEVAKECSGINSSLALLITTLLLAHETLRSNWRRLILILISVPLSIVKNAIRITTLTILAIRIDPSFLTGRLHHQGGFVFFLITFAIMYPLWRFLHTADQADRSSRLRLSRSVEGSWSARSARA